MPIYYNDGSNSSNGRIVQMQTAELRSSMTSTLSSFEILAKAITPKASANVIMMISMVSAMSNANHCGLAYYRGSTRLNGAGTHGATANYLASASFDNNNFGSNSNASYGEVTMLYIDAPNTTNQITYKIQMEQVPGNGALYVNRSPSQYQGSTTRLILMEIAV